MNTDDILFAAEVIDHPLKGRLAPVAPMAGRASRELSTFRRVGDVVAEIMAKLNEQRAKEGR